MISRASAAFVAAYFVPVLLASPLLTTTFTIDGTAVVVLNEVVSTVTIHDGGTSTIHDQPCGTPMPLAGGAATPTIISVDYSTPTGQGPAPTNLMPAIHPTIDPTNHQNLLANTAISLFYSDPAPPGVGNVFPDPNDPHRITNCRT
jgi:hypothetical protein